MYSTNPEHSRTSQHQYGQPGGHLEHANRPSAADFLSLVDAWEIRAMRIHALQQQASSMHNDGEAIYFPSINLYYGHTVNSLRLFQEAAPGSIDSHLRVTFAPRQAFGTMLASIKNQAQFNNPTVSPRPRPAVFEVAVQQATFLDLRNSIAAHNFLPHYADTLATYAQPKAEKTLSVSGNRHLAAVMRCAHILRNHQETPHLPIVEQVLHATAHLLAPYLIGLGYDGVITLATSKDRREKIHQDEHATVLLAQPSKLAIVQSVEFCMP